MFDVSHERQKGLETANSNIGREGATESRVKAPGVLPGGELVAALTTMCRRGTVVSDRGPQRLSAGVTVDFSVAGPRGAFGVVCDDMDANRIRLNPESLSDSGLDRVYCLSALDSLFDPVGAARSLARNEPGYFRRVSQHAGGRTTPLEAFRVQRRGVAGTEADDNPGTPSQPASPARAA